MGWFWERSSEKFGAELERRHELDLTEGGWTSGRMAPGKWDKAPMAGGVEGETGGWGGVGTFETLKYIPANQISTVQ